MSGGALIDFECVSAPRMRRKYIQTFSSGETALFHISVGRHSRVFRSKHFENFLWASSLTDLTKKCIFTVDMFWKVLFYLSRPVTVETSTLSHQKLVLQSYNITMLQNFRQPYSLQMKGPSSKSDAYICMPTGSPSVFFYLGPQVFAPTIMLTWSIVPQKTNRDTYNIFWGFRPDL